MKNAKPWIRPSAYTKAVKAHARRQARQALCQSCIWRNRYAGVNNCLFPRCVRSKTRN